MSPAGLPEDLLSAYLDDELDAATRAAVEVEVARSTEWQAVFAEVRAARDAVRGLPTLDLSADAWADVFAAVAASEPVVTAGPAPPPPPLSARVAALGARVPRRPLRWAGLAGAAAAAALLAAVIVPAQRHVTPKVATFNTEHVARGSVVGDPVTNLAGVGMLRGLGR